MNLTVYLDYVQEQMNRYLAPAIFIFGVIGNTLNCIVLGQPTLRSNPCALLFLVSSFVDLISILVGLPTRILAGWNLDPTATITWICRFRAFVVFTTRTIAAWLIMFATVDRWLLSSVDIHRRQLSSIKNIRTQILVTFVLSIAVYAHMLYCYEANLNDQPLQCYGKSEQCRFATDMIYALVTIVIPLIGMMTFGLMTIVNVRRAQRRAHPDLRATSDVNHHSRRVNNQLLRMLFVQVLFLIVLCVPQAIQKFYSTVRPFGAGSTDEDAVKTLLYNIELLLAFIASGMPFYIYTLFGETIFRKEFIHVIEKIRKKRMGMVRTIDRTHCRT
ncbi:unnamed protein product [Adineta ricciae]|uniref:G-protein coupled receptors family 1 profile domain-containing protein n=1 Tax=Adineta ricciae TaxID=249248 RepID=A0A815HG89_ADIRI|nr:unnamed protein product [Adineta ricciae]